MTTTPRKWTGWRRTLGRTYLAVFDAQLGAPLMGAGFLFFMDGQKKPAEWLIYLACCWYMHDSWVRILTSWQESQ